MAKLTDLHIYARCGEDRIDFTTPVSVSKDGRFSTRLPEAALKTLKDYGYDGFKVNRIGNEGYFSSDTLAGLEHQLKEIAQDALTQEIVEDKLVIKYILKGRYCYCTDKRNPNEIYPNGYYVHGEENMSWRQDELNYTRTYTPSASIYAQVFHKRKYRYSSGKTVEYYDLYAPQRRGDTGSAVDWINNLVHIGFDMGWGTLGENIKKLPEVDATPENAALFVNIFKFIFKAATLMDMIRKPEGFVRAVKEGQLKQITDI